ncbi:adenine-specific DNA-methyltransferase [Raineyella antarctica]|uniref:Adenine-specific DNA-methyltransferase n=1 Tax=Raineyella antarctica TaxID=1577474 RepID=A0A1G6GDV9_9ACTN|nr:DNA adenine methylase [Raineyella antarctica]SDB79925.1 adenine-specific DNA-methyltransferase [Raineyella antarctica]
MIKYLGSKRTLVPVLGRLARAAEAGTALDLFTGTTRVAQEFCRQGAYVTAVDTAAYADVFARTYVELDAATVDVTAVRAAIDELNALPGTDGYVTETFCHRSRYFQPHNGRRIDAIRDAIERRWAGTWLWPVLLTSLLEAADAVDSTVGLQMAYLKKWSPRSYNGLRLAVPAFTPGTGRAVRTDAQRAVDELDRVDLAYLDSPYNQHRYYTNYHVWETLVRWDAPEVYGVACKRVDCRDAATKSPFNSRRTMPAALASVVEGVRADVVAVSINDESFVSRAEVEEMCRARGGAVEVLAFDSRRYVGSVIGVYDGKGRKVGSPGARSTTEFILLAGDPDRVAAMVELAADPGTVDPGVEPGTVDPDTAAVG